MNATIDGTDVQLSDRDLPAFSFALRDLRDPGKAKGNRSTSFKVPATSQARALMGGPVMAQESLGPFLLRIGSAGVEIYSSSVVPTDITRDEIELMALGGNASWFAQAKSTKLSQVDLGDSPIITSAYMQETWTNPEDTLIFPFINYGAILDSSDSSADVNPNYLRPAIRTWKLLKAAFGSFGYALKIEGTLGSIWKKLILPNTEKIAVADSYLDLNRAVLNGSGTVSPVSPVSGAPPWPPFAAPVALPPSPTTVEDPGGNIAGNTYTAPLNMRIKVKLNGMIRSVGTPGSSATYRIPIYNTTGGNIPIAITEFIATGILHEKVFNDETIAEVNLTAAQAIKTGLWKSGGAGYSTQIVDLTVTYEVISVEYQVGIAVDIAGTAPNMSVMDLIMGIANLQCLLISTNDATHTVTIAWEDDFLKRPETDGIDMSGRVDHTQAPIKRSDILPRNYLFRFKEDSQDFDVKAINATLTGRNYGDHDEPIGGTADDVTIQLPFAATAMQLSVLGGLTIPVMRDHDGTTTTSKYTWAPRLLIADGLAEGNWRFDGDDLTLYPRCYFVWPGETRYGLSFHTETTYGKVAPGTAQSLWQGRIRRDTSPQLVIGTRWHDDELMDLDFGAPRFIHDGHMALWYYIGEIDRHKFSSGEFTPTTFIPA